MKRLILLSLVFMAGCINLPAHQRGRLMSASMSASDSALESGLDAHVHQTRESMIGGTTAGGVSCGCN